MLSEPSLLPFFPSSLIPHFLLQHCVGTNWLVRHFKGHPYTHA